MLSTEDWNEMDRLRREIGTAGPASVSPADLERFSTLFAESIRGKGDVTPIQIRDMPGK